MVPRQAAKCPVERLWIAIGRFKSHAEAPQPFGECALTEATKKAVSERVRVAGARRATDCQLHNELKKQTLIVRRTRPFPAGAPYYTLPNLTLIGLRGR